MGATEVEKVSDVSLFPGSDVFMIGRTTDIIMGMVYAIPIYVKAWELRPLLAPNMGFQGTQEPQQCSRDQNPAE